MTQKLHDSGKRRTFKSGAVRDRGDLKPRPDLISPHAQLREGMIMTLGAQKYDLRNWEKGMPISECLASSQRHIEQYKRGDIDEDHLAQARWNLGVAIHFEEEIKAGRLDPEFDDMPKYDQQPKGLDLSKPLSWKTVSIEIPILEGEPIVTPDGALNPRYYDNLKKKTLVALEFDKPTFYLTGPMRSKPQLNFPLFDAAAKLAREQGLNVISPAELDREAGINDPNDMDCTRITDPNFIQTIIQRDCKVIINLHKDRGDGLILLPEWFESTGARAEVALALWLGLRFKVFVTIVDPSDIRDRNSIWIEQMLFRQS